MHTSIDGLETHYQSMGKGKTLVLLHGWGCDWQIWHTIIPLLSEQYHLVIPDLPAFGQSHNPPTAWNSADYLEWLEGFLQAVVKDQKVVLMGHSFGGKIAALFAAAHPNKVEKLILVDSSGLPTPLTTTQKLKQSMIRMIPDKLKTAMPRKSRAALLSRFGLATDYVNSTPTQQAIMKRIVHERIADELASISVPTTLIWGANDQDTPLSHAEQFHSLVQGSTLEVLPTAGHFPFIDEPQHFVNIVQESIKK